MQDSDLENIYKSAINISHYAGLRAVYDAGFYAGQGTNITATTGDASNFQAAPTATVNITTP